MVWGVNKFVLFVIECMSNRICIFLYSFLYMFVSIYFVIKQYIKFVTDYSLFFMKLSLIFWFEVIVMRNINTKRVV